MTSVSSSPARDLRLDLFRGLALVCIFIDHIPGNRWTNYTIRNLGFADASEVFVFISACAAGLVYGKRLAGEGFGSTVWRVWQRAAVVYVAHVLLVIASVALAGWLTRALGDPQFVQGLNVQPMLSSPWPAFLDTLRLSFQPTFNNILPLYFVLLVSLPAMLWLVRRQMVAALAVSVACYLAARVVPALVDSPSGQAWEFNPLAWQLLFTIGVGVGVWAAEAGRGLRVPRTPTLVALAGGYVFFAFLSQHRMWPLTEVASMAPDWLDALVFPVPGRANLSPWRLAHVLSLAYVVAYLVRPESEWLRSRVMRPLIRCGQHSLPLFGGGVLLSILGWATIASLGDGALVLLGVNVSGMAVMFGQAWVLSRRSR